MNVFKSGPVPKHMGVLMDGNRRYARRESLATIEGHRKGIENFKRPQEEVNGLMNLFKEKLQDLLEELEQSKETGLCVQIIGDWSLIPADLKPLMAKVMLKSRHHTKFKLNLAFAYTGRNEIVRGIRSVGIGLLNNQILPEEVSDELLAQAFHLLPTQPLDLLVRTSGESRLSDFLLWQSTETVLCFADALWPEYTIWHLMAAVFYYQHNIMYMNSLNLKQSCSSDVNDLETLACKRQTRFLEQIRQKMWKVLEKEAAMSSPS